MFDSSGTYFQRLIPELGVATEKPSNIERLIFCSGRVFYDLLKERKETQKEDRIAIARVEQVTFNHPLVSLSVPTLLPSYLQTSNNPKQVHNLYRYEWLSFDGQGVFGRL